VLVARRFVFFDFNLKAEALLAALTSLTRQRKMAETSEVMKEAKALSVAEAESILWPWLSLVGRA
jgi:hypothetical protein